MTYRLGRAAAVFALGAALCATLLPSALAGPPPNAPAANDVAYEAGYIPGGTVRVDLGRTGLRGLSTLRESYSDLLPMSAEHPKPISLAQERQITAENFGRGPGYETGATPTSSRAGGPKLSAAVAYDLLSKQECIDKAKYQTAQGFGKNHYAWCAYGQAIVTKKVKGVPVAAFTVISTVIGQGTREGRVMKFTQYLDNVQLIGQWAAGVNLHAEIWRGGWPTAKQCSMGGGYTGTVHQGQSLEFYSTATSSTSGASGKDKIGTCVIAPTLTVSDSQGGWSGRLVDYGFRCDTAKGFGTTAVSACIFDRVAAYVTFSQSDTAVAGAAHHMNLALTSPDKTYPKKKGKVIPHVLSRLYYDGDRKKANRDTSVKACKKAFGSYKGTGKDCDEFPFAATYEGSSKAHGNFSVKLVDGAQNKTAGSRLNGWFKTDHIIDGDKFSVNIIS